MKKIFVLLSLLSISSATLAGALRVPVNGETSDYAIKAASLIDGKIYLDARKYQRDVNDKIQEKERKFFTVSAEVLKSSGVEAGSLINLVLNKNITVDVSCTVENFSSKKAAAVFDCSSLSINAVAID